MEGPPSSSGGANSSGGSSVGGSAVGGSAAVGGSSGGSVSGNGGSVGANGGGVASGGAVGGGAAAGGGGAGGSDANGGSVGGGVASGGSSSEGATLIPDPSWTCGLPGGIVAPELGTLVFETDLEVGEVYEVGKTQYGERRVLDIQGGAVTSAKLNADFLEGGLDFELELSNGAIELEQVNMLRANDGALIYMRTCGVAQAGESTVRIVPDFEVATSSSLAWLNTGKFVGTRSFDAAAKKLALSIYDVAAASASGSEIELVDPEADLDQPWECSKKTGSRGASVFTETVTLGSSLSVGTSKNGTRNVIPITGGTVTGRFEGRVSPGGADYQLISGSTVLDARYTLASNDGEYVVVRNCGAFGALIPWFETRADGPYAFLNEGEFLSSDPGSASGGVSITFYERQ